MDSSRAAPDDSWQMFEQSARLLVNNAIRTPMITGRPRQLLAWRST
jgi:hypothetical protein